MKFLFSKLAFSFVLSLSWMSGFSQWGFSQEIGVILGPVALQSDFGTRQNLETNAGNTGIGIGLIHYINFAYRADCNCYSSESYFNDHFKLRSELSWNKTKLHHFGKWTELSRTSDAAHKLRAHSGEANNWDVGMQIEYYPWSIRAFSASRGSYAPFISIGSHFVAYQPKVTTSYGDGNINNANNFYAEWVNAASPNPFEDPFVSEKSGTTWSIIGSIGTRYKLTILSDLMVDLRWQYYFNNWIDGLNHNLPSNKANDYLVWLNFGYIYYLD